jgi:hypothetical protein
VGEFEEDEEEVDESPQADAARIPHTSADTLNQARR